jgi:hypothetical protein
MGMSSAEKNIPLTEIGPAERDTFERKAYLLMVNPKDQFPSSHKWTTRYKKGDIEVRLEIPEPGHAAKHFYDGQTKHCEDHLEPENPCMFNNMIKIDITQPLIKDDDVHVSKAQSFRLFPDAERMTRTEVAIFRTQEGFVIPTKIVDEDNDPSHGDAALKQNFDTLMQIVNSLTPEEEVKL